MSDDGFPAVGRHRLSMEDTRAAFVDSEMFLGSKTRAACWDGWMSYLDMWRTVEKKMVDVLGCEQLLMAAWLGGSFVSTKIDPNNIDVTVFVNGDVLRRAKEGKVSQRNWIDKLSSRRRWLEEFKVSPIVVTYHYFRSPMWHDSDEATRTYRLWRGGLDEWWCRARPRNEPKGPPEPRTGKWVRGYVEVPL